MPFGAPIRRRRRRRRRCSTRSPSAGSTGTPSGSCARSTPLARSRCCATATSCPTTCSSAYRCTAAPRSSRLGAARRRLDPVDPLTLETAYPGVYAVGDVTSVGTPEGRRVRRGSGRGRGRADRRPVRGDRPTDVRRPRHLLPRVRPRPGRARSTSPSSAARPVGELEGPSDGLAADKAEFGVEPDPPLVRARVVVRSRLADRRRPAGAGLSPRR